MNAQEIKTKLYEYCLAYIDEKHQTLQRAIDDAQTSLSAETKSTAGDKHDTSRAMMHLEVEKKGKQINELIQQKRVLLQFEPHTINDNIGLGSLVQTNLGTFYIAISVGKVDLNNENYFLISMASPLAQALKRHFQQKAFKFLNKEYEILKVS